MLMEERQLKIAELIEKKDIPPSQNSQRCSTFPTNPPAGTCVF